MAASPSSSRNDGPEKFTTQAEEEQEYVLHVGWKALFSFTTRNHIPVLLGALVGATIAAIIMPVFAIIYGLIFSKYSDFGAGRIDNAELMSSVSKYCIIIAGLASLNWIANSFYFFFFLTFGELQARSARNRIFDVLIQKDMAWYDTRDAGVAAFLPAIQMHIRDLQLSVSAPFGEGVQCLIQSLAALCVSFYYSWNLTLVIMCTIPVIYLVQAFIGQRLSTRVHGQAETLQRALKYMTNAIQSIEAVKCFNGEAYELLVFTRISSLAAGFYYRVANYRSIQIGVMQFFTLSVFVQGFWYGSRLVDSGKMTAAQVLTTFWAALMAIEGITGFLPQFIVLQKGKIAGARLRLLMKQISASDQSHERKGQLKPVKCVGDIEFRQVTFSYPTRADDLAIRDLSLFFPAGEMTFVIGRSGSGKSTLGQLLVRFYQPSAGEILFDGVKLDQLDSHWLRENVTLVEQHSVLFNDSIRQNIALGGQSGVVSLEDVQDAVKFAMLDTIVYDLSEGLDTQLGISGSSLSGGQKQRMALARARVRDSPVLILDEATSALDYVTKAAILKTIRDWRKGKTTIVITHDITQIRFDDFLYLMDNANKVQEGYRKDLEAQPGPFQAFLATHNRCEEDEETGSDNSSDTEYYADDIMSLYEGSWEVDRSVRRPLSAILFGEAVLQPISKHDSESWLGARTVLETRSSRYEYGEESLHSKRNSFIKLGGSLKAPPGMPSSAPGNFPTRSQDSKSSSRASNRTSIVRSPSYRGLKFDSKEFGSRPTSQSTTRPVSRYASYPRPLMIYNTCSRASPENLKKRRRVSKMLSKVGRSRQKGNAEAADASTDSFSILEIFKSVWPTLEWRTRMMLLGAFFCALIHAAAVPVFSWVFAQLLATFYQPGDSSKGALKYALAILVIGVIDGLVSYLLFFLSDAVAQSWTLALKTEAMRRILMQPREFFDKEENSISRIAETLDHFAEEARNLPGRFACIFVVILIMVAISIVWSIVTSWKLALVALATAPILYGITQGYNAISSRWERYSSDADEKVGQVLHETFVNIRTVRCLVLEDHFRKKYHEATTAAINVGIKRAIYSGSIFGLNFAGVIFVATLLFWYGGLLISRDEYTVKSIMETFLVLMLSVNHVNFMAHYMTQVNISRDAGTRLLRLARLPTTSHELTGTKRISEAGDISFKSVNFTYPTRKNVQVLHNVSFNIPRGNCTAIVGSTGSGKSTIASLLLKLYPPDSYNLNNASNPFEPSQHSLTISDYDINTLHTNTLRSYMAIVSQSPVLFPGTVAENIAYGISPSSHLASIRNIRAAAEAAGVSDFIDSLPQGYYTLIGDGGTGLSGGQAQRLAIARALVREPDILILDEATSALDVASAAVVRDTILRLVNGATEEQQSQPGCVWEDKDWDGSFSSSGKSGSRGKAPRKQMTVIIITHAREMMAVAEHIIMIDKGRVVEEGSFRELKKRKGGAFGRLLRGEAE